MLDGKKDMEGSTTVYHGRSRSWYATVYRGTDSMGR